MPDFERRSSASFISSKEGGTPASFSRSLMKRRSSYCLRVSISSIPPVGTVFRSRSLWSRSLSVSNLQGPSRESPNPQPQTLAVETNHERTLYVRYVFRNHLISGERIEASAEDTLKRAVQGVIPAAGAARNANPLRQRARTADVSQVPVPQRDSPIAMSPGGSPAPRSACRP